jgi:hypothetical protein
MVPRFASARGNEASLRSLFSAIPLTNFCVVEEERQLITLGPQIHPNAFSTNQRQIKFGSG